MRPAYRGNTVRRMDALCIEQLGIPARQLMELAGRGAAEAVARRWPTGEIAVLCGPGNNGGDGFVIARWLALWGRAVRLWSPRTPDSDAARANRALCERMGLPMLGLDAAVAGAAVLIDALLGTGQRAAPQGAALDGVRACRRARAAGAAVVALDLPTGLHADTGQPLGAEDEVVEADLTLTFGFLKPGLCLAPGLVIAGEVEVIDIGLGHAALVEPALLAAELEVGEPGDLDAALPKVGRLGAKWDRGHVAIRAEGGAAVLAAQGALASGAGWVTVLCPEVGWGRLHGLPPDVVLAAPSALDPQRHDVLVVGPGLGAAGAAALLAAEAFPGIVIVDADAILPLREASAALRGRVVLTPHSAEAAALLGLRRARVEADRLDALRQLRSFGLPVLKGPGSLIGDRVPACWPVADARLSVAGSGDVLAGLIGGLVARCCPRGGEGLGAVVSAAVGLHAHAAAELPPGGRAGQLAGAIAAAWERHAPAAGQRARPPSAPA